MIKVEYRSNNSGGSWWLTDRNWIQLETAGWYVDWGGLNFCYSKYDFDRDKKFKSICSRAKADAGKCPGHRKYKSYIDVGKDARWLGAPAKSCWKKFRSITEALQEFEKVTKQDVTAEGCNCCGAPHLFEWVDEDGTQQYASGERLLGYLFPDKVIPRSLREVVEGE